jgi:simple sugar transport system substrate-binding protein
MRDAAEMLGVSCDFRGTKDVDVAAQAAMLRRAVDEGYDGIACNIIDPAAFDAVIQEAIEQDVPVVGFNVDDDATPNPRLSSVNQKLYEAGRRLAEHVAPSIPAGSQVLLTMHDEGVSALEDRARGLREALREKRLRWTTLVTGNDAPQAADRIAETLGRNPDIRIVLGTGQSDTEAAGRALASLPSGQGYWSAGFDLSPATLQMILDGPIRCTVDQQPYLQGFLPVVQLTLYLRYGILPSDIDAGANLIDRSNAAQVLELSKSNYR